MKTKFRLLSILCLFTVTAMSCGSDDGGDDQGPGGSGETITIPTTGFTAPTSYTGMSLVWEDDFTGNTLDVANWTHETGTGQNGWGNNELQYYRSNNTSFQDGHLIISAKEESFSGSSYTSSRIISQNKKQYRYGRVDVRAVLPEGQGMWPAVWMLGSNFNTVGWPACGEIDIMEMVGGNNRENTVHGTVHWENSGQHADFGRSTTKSSGDFSDQFHVFSIGWDASSIRWFVDGVQFNVIDTSPAELDEFRRNFFFILNLAVGGSWPGSPDATTTFPQHMIVDYVRVYQAD